jgi:hypothetical protein
VDFGFLTDVLTRLILGFVIGFATGMTGIGAGVLVMPSLIYLVGLSPVVAVGTGLLYSVLIRIYGIFEHLRLRTVRKRTAFYIAVGSVPAVAATSLMITRLSESSGKSVDYALKIIISSVMLVTWSLMLINMIKSHKKHKEGIEDYYIPQDHFPLRRKLYGIFSGVGVGVLIGSTSIGGGVLIVPILVTIFGLSPNNTVGTSMMISIIMASVGSFVYLLEGSINSSVAVMMFFGSIPGVFLGCRMSVRVSHRVLSTILFTVITIGVIAMFVGLRR